MRQLSVPFKESIAMQLMRIVFGLYCLAALVITTVQLTLEYYHTKEVILQELEALPHIFGPGIANALWTFNYDFLQSSLTGMQEIPIVIGVSVADYKGQPVMALGTIQEPSGRLVEVAADGTRTPVKASHQSWQETLVYSFNISHIDSRGQRYHVGTGSIYSSSQVVIQRVHYGFILIAINAVLKSVLLWGLFYYVARRMLSQPLGEFTQFVKHVGWDTTVPSKLQIGLKGKNELHVLVDAFNRLIAELFQTLLNQEQARQAIERSEQQLLEQNDLLGALSHQKMFQIEDPYAHLRTILETATKYLKVSRASVWLFNEDRTLGTCIDLYDVHKGHIQESDFTISEVPTYLRNLPQRTTLTSQDLLNDPRFDDSLKAYSRANNIFASLEAPIYLHRELQGTFIVEHLHHPRRWTVAEERFVVSLADQITLELFQIETYQRIREKERMEAELRTAAAVQQALFPKAQPNIRHLDVASYYQSATETGGDWYGFMTEIEDSFFILIGDVTGHGTPSALVTATACATCRLVEDLHHSKVPSAITPSLLLEHLNRAVYRSGKSNYLMTFFVAQVDLTSGMMTYVNAGHNFPFLVRQGAIKPLLLAGQPLGQNCETTYAEKTLQLEFGDLLFFYTDGLTEQYNPEGQMWGERRLGRYLRQHTDSSAAEIVSGVLHESKTFADSAPPEDDITMVVCKVRTDF